MEFWPFLSATGLIILRWDSPCQNNLKNLDLSYKTDLDFWGCFREGETCYNQMNIVLVKGLKL